ncbi:MAG: ligase-associated DNA damage response endonuclease PdeM [Ahrensia sp.]
MTISLRKPAPLAPTRCAIGKTLVTLDPAGVLFMDETSTLVVSDLHLEKGSSFARRRQYLPPYDTGETLKRLALLVAKYQPRTLVSLGDSFHDDDASARLSVDAVAAIEALAAGRTMVWVTGNHDPSPPANVPGETVEELMIEDINLRHIAKRGENGPEMSGHYHPCAKIHVRGKSVRRPCFATDQTRMILPSFGAYTGGLNVRDKAYAGLFDPQRLCAYMLGTDRIYPIAAKTLAL